MQQHSYVQLKLPFATSDSGRAKFLELLRSHQPRAAVSGLYAAQNETDRISKGRPQLKLDTELIRLIEGEFLYQLDKCNFKEAEALRASLRFADCKVDFVTRPSINQKAQESIQQYLINLSAALKSDGQVPSVADRSDVPLPNWTTIQDNLNALTALIKSFNLDSQRFDDSRQKVLIACIESKRHFKFAARVHLALEMVLDHSVDAVHSAYRHAIVSLDAKMIAKFRELITDFRKINPAWPRIREKIFLGWIRQAIRRGLGTGSYDAPLKIKAHLKPLLDPNAWQEIVREPRVREAALTGLKAKPSIQFAYCCNYMIWDPGNRVPMISLQEIATITGETLEKVEQIYQRLLRADHEE